jgi:hypothetical protein
VRALLLLFCSCATVPPGEADNLRRARFEGTCTSLRSIDCDFAVEGQVFMVNGLFTDHETDWLPSRDGMVPRTTKIADADGWRIRCETQHEVDVGGSDQGGVYRTTGMSTQCKSEGRAPAVELYMEGWPKLEGLLLAGGKEYVISSRLYNDRLASLLITERTGSLRLVVGKTDQVWLRRGIDREERKMLLRVAAALWTAPALRAHEGARIRRRAGRAGAGSRRWRARAASRRCVRRDRRCAGCPAES